MYIHAQKKKSLEGLSRTSALASFVDIHIYKYLYREREGGGGLSRTSALASFVTHLHAYICLKSHTCKLIFML